MGNLLTAWEPSSWRGPKGDLEESPQGTFFQSKHFRGIFNTSRSFSQKAAFLLQANSFAIQLHQKVHMNNVAVAVALLRLVDLVVTFYALRGPAVKASA